MKKISLILSAILFLSFTIFCVMVGAGSTSDYLDQQTTAANQWADVRNARARMQDATNVVQNVIADLEQIIAAGSFDTVDANYKAVLLRWKALLDAYKAGVIADAEVLEDYQWRP